MQKQNAAKRAMDPTIPYTDADASRRDLAQNLMKVLAISGGIGVLGRGLVGASDAANEPAIDPLMHTSSIPTPLPVLVHQQKKKPQRVLPGYGMMPKVAFGGAGVDLNPHAQLGGAGIGGVHVPPAGQIPKPQPAGAVEGIERSAPPANHPPLPDPRSFYQRANDGITSMARRVAPAMPPGLAGIRQREALPPLQGLAEGINGAIANRPLPTDPPPRPFFVDSRMGLAQDDERQLNSPPATRVDRRPDGFFNERDLGLYLPNHGRRGEQPQLPPAGSSRRGLWDSDPAVADLVAHPRLAAPTDIAADRRVPGGWTPGESLPPREKANAAKRAAGPAAPPPTTLPDDFTQQISRHLPTPTNRSNPLADRLGMPMAVLGGAGALYGGWKLTDWLLKKNRKGDMANQITSAQKEYNDALAAQYRAAMLAKGGEDPLGIDSLFDTMAKSAGLGASLYNAAVWPWKKMLGDENGSAAEGVALTAMGLTGIGAGMATYNWTKGRNQNKLLDKALRMRAQQRQFNPTPFYAVPQSTTVE